MKSSVSGSNDIKTCLIEGIGKAAKISMGEQQKNAFIFDMDGTLVDNMAFHSKAWLVLFESLDIHLEAEDFQRRTAGSTNQEILRKITGRDLSTEDIRNLSDRKESFYREIFTPYLKAVGGLLPFLAQAKETGIPMAIATAAGRENIDFVLGGLQIREYFQAIVGAEDIQKGKPDPEIFLKCAHRLRVAPEACIVFEDSPNGVEAARRAGMKAVFLTTSHQVSELGDQKVLILAASDFTSLDLPTILSFHEQIGSTKN